MEALNQTSTSNEWRFIRRSNGGGEWGLIVPSGQPESVNDRALRQQRAAERAAVKAAKLARLKPRNHRNSDYCYQVANCPPNESDLADLTRRGLTAKDLAELTPINDGHGGYIIPIRDINGLMVGGQRRLANTANGSRYRWATTGENHLPDTGELPLAHWYGSDEVKIIALVEGTGVKPYLAAKRLGNALAIGASGGTFASSPQTLKLALDQHPDLPVLLVPDAGAVSNAGIMRRYCEAYQLTKKFGRDLKILWWGQESKPEKGCNKPKEATERDFDEIDPKLFTTEITWDEFTSIAYKRLGAEFLTRDKTTGTEAESGQSEQPKIPPALEMSKKIFSDLFSNKIRFDSSVKQYWRYDGQGKWVECSEDYVFGITQDYIEEATTAPYSPNYVQNVIKLAKKNLLCEGWTEASSLVYLPFTNGVLELATDKLLPHSPDYGFTWQLPRHYSSSDTSWDNIDKFLTGFCGGNGQLKDIAIAFCNAAIKGRADLQKFLYLFGSGANGKGAFMNLLTMLVGQENTHSTTMAELNDSRFESANLKGKRLVLMTDEDRRVGGFGIFKAATGQDPIRYERKGKDASNFIFKGIFVVAANTPTFVGESNPALKRRKVDFPCLARIAESDRRDLTPEFDADLPAFTTYLLSLPDKWVTARIRGASAVEAVKKLGWEMAVREDSIAGFYEEYLICDLKGIVSCGELYKKYQDHCTEFGLKAKSLNNFTPSLLELCNESLGFSVIKNRNKRGNILEGIRYKQPEEQYNEDTSNNTQKNLSSPKDKNISLISKRYTQPTQSIDSNSSRHTPGIHRVYTEYTDRFDTPDIEVSF